jgi:hypothetical protein
LEARGKCPGKPDFVYRGHNKMLMEKALRWWRTQGYKFDRPRLVIGRR